MENPYQPGGNIALGGPARNPHFSIDFFEASRVDSIHLGAWSQPGSASKCDEG